MRPKYLGRRATIAGLASAWAPFRVVAQTPPAAPPQITPAVPPQLTPPSVPIVPHPPAAPITPATAIDKSKTYYVFFEQQVDVNTMLALRRQLTALVEAGVSQITLVLDSPGGLLDPTLITYSFLRALPVTFNTHAAGFVQSAATILFLAGQGRTADRTARFLFHASSTAVLGTFNEEQLRDRLDQVRSVREVLAAIYLDRTKLSKDQVDHLTREQVILTADQALDAGVVDHVEDLKIPGPDTARILLLG
jgi:ATP-dependent Clp protease protease subunit